MTLSPAVSRTIRRNFLLAALPPRSLAALERDLRIEEVPVGRIVFQAEAANDVLFPLDAVVSLLREFEDGTSVEVGMVGPEGLAGLNAVLGVSVNTYAAIIQGRGVIGRIRGSVLREHVLRDASIRDLLLKYAYAFTAMTAQVAACNRLHVVTERLAHWLLLLQDRVGADEMSLTQEFLALMLGTRRAGVNVAVRELKSAGAIDHKRNRVMVTNRARLEELSCECYALMVREYERAVGFTPVARSRTTPVD